MLRVSRKALSVVTLLLYVASGVISPVLSAADALPATSDKTSEPVYFVMYPRAANETPADIAKRLSIDESVLQKLGEKVAGDAWASQHYWLVPQTADKSFKRGAIYLTSQNNLTSQIASV